MVMIPELEAADTVEIEPAALVWPQGGENLSRPEESRGGGPGSDLALVR